MLEYKVITQEERKSAWSSVKKCDGCERRLPTNGKILLSLTQLGPMGYCGACARDELASAITTLAGMIMDIETP